MASGPAAGSRLAEAASERGGGGGGRLACAPGLRVRACAAPPRPRFPRRAPRGRRGLTTQERGFSGNRRACAEIPAVAPGRERVGGLELGWALRRWPCAWPPPAVEAAGNELATPGRRPWRTTWHRKETFPSRALLSFSAFAPTFGVQQTCPSTVQAARPRKVAPRVGATRSYAPFRANAIPCA